jgi:ubiquitin C-terminal hydrolase
MEIEILSTGRVIERLIVVAFAGISIILGYKLFLKGVITPQSGSFKFSEVSVDLTKVGPGIFFSLFGTIILYSAHSHNLTYAPHKSGETIENPIISYFSSNNLEYVKALSTSIEVLSEHIEQNTPSQDKQRMIASRDELTAARKQLMLSNFNEHYERYLADFDNSVINPNNFSEQTHLTFQKIEKLMNPR